MKVIQEKRASAQVAVGGTQRLPAPTDIQDVTRDIVRPLSGREVAMNLLWLLPRGWANNPFGLLERVELGLNGLRPVKVSLVTQWSSELGAPRLILDFTWQVENEG